MDSTSGTSSETWSARAAQHRLVLIIGPIASGKSTLAAELADRLRSAGEAVAVVGLDTVAEMALPTLDDWTWAHEIHGQVVGAWLATPIRTVIAEGPATPGEIEQIMRHVPSDVSVFKVLIVTQYETALKRAAADPGRGISKEPAFLKRKYRRFEKGLPGITWNIRLDSEESAPGSLAAIVIAALPGVHDLQLRR